MAFIKNIRFEVLGYILAISSGTFIYIASSDLLPEIHRKKEWRLKNLIGFILGIGLIFGSKFGSLDIH